MLLNTLANWFLGRLAAVRYKRFSSPASWRVWLLCLIPLAIAIPYITMSLNQPTLPLRNALACFVATVIGLALALSPSSLASQSPKELTWLVFGGIGLVPCLLLSRAIELPAKGLASVQTAFLLAIGSLVAGSIWMVIVAWVRVKSKKPPIRAMSLFMAGLCLSYLLLPLLHYLLLVPPKFRYISASTNFFAFSMIGQIVVFLVAAALAVGSAELQTRWQNDSHRAR